MKILNYTIEFKNQIISAISAVLKSKYNLENVDPGMLKFETPPDINMGHLALACFPFAKLLRNAPQKIAQELSENWVKSNHFKKVEANGPYLNFFFNPSYLKQFLLKDCMENLEYGKSKFGSGKTIMVEYSSPNTNKPLHLGHGRNNLLGMVVANLLEQLDYQVVKTNLVNDRGIHICKSMYAYQKYGNGETPESSGLKGDKLIGKYYVIYNQKEKENPEIAEDIKQMLRDWENGDAEVRSLWKKLNGWVLEGFNHTYQRMGATFDRLYFESETYTGGREAILEAFESGICEKEPNGAISIDLEDVKLGKKILLRGDGTSMYITQDINTTINKFANYDLDHSLFVVGNEQENHFNVLFAILKKFGYDWADRCEHVSYGMVNLPEGKMKSREGTVVDFDDLMDSMKSLAAEELQDRYTTNNNKHQIENLDDTAEAIAQSAIKYFILKTNLNKDISFNPKESLSFDGATGPYLQYTHARICSLLNKSSEEPIVIEGDNNTYNWNEEEIKLQVGLVRFPDAIQQSALDRNPAVLCSYIYELCRTFNKFYYEHQILKTECAQTRNNRLLICKAVKAVLGKTLNILGIEALTRM